MPPKNKRTRTGGIRQRRKQAKMEEQAIMGHSVLASFLLQLFAWGEMSAQRVQKIASLAMLDIEACMNGTGHAEDLKNMAKIGTEGHHQNKCYADLMKQCLDISIPRPFVATLPFVKPLHDQFQSMLLPHELFSSIYHSYKGAWRQSLYGSADSVRKFWQAQASHPQMAGHPVSFKPNRFTLAIPLSLHGDDVPVTGVGKAWTGKLTQWCWASLLGRGATSEVLFWIYGLFERLRVILTAGSESTLHTFFRILRWSFHWLFKGVFPDRDHDGVKPQTTTLAQFSFLWITQGGFC